MGFNINMAQVVNDMIQAASGSLVKGGQTAIAYAKQEFQQFIEDLDHINNMLKDKKISQEDAQYYVDLHKSSMKAVLLTIEGLGVIAVQNAINAALAILNKALNTAIGSLKI